MADLCRLLVNGFCVVLFEGLDRAAAFEAKTGEKRSPAPPEVENTVKGPKDAFTESLRTNTSLVRRHIKAPEARDLGLIGYVVPDGSALDKAHEIASLIAGNGPLSVVSARLPTRMPRIW